MKTIKMPKALADTWLADLRSGKYPQGRRTLECDGAYCCLGVLQKGADGKVERTLGGTVLHLPSPKWLSKHNVEFCESDGALVCNPFLPTLGMSAASANDNGKTFAEIADAIEAALETT